MIAISLILNATRLNKKKKKTKPHNCIKITIIKLRDKDHHTFSYGPNLLLNSQPHIYFIVITYHIHIFSSHQRKEKREREENLKCRRRLWCTNRRPVEIEVAERTKLAEISVHQNYLVPRPTAVRPPPHHQIGSDWLVLFFFFFIFACSDSTLL